MNYCIYKLKFLSPAHFGASESARSLESANLFLCADTVFSAMCHAALRVGALNELVSAVKDNALRLSDAMPYRGNDLYLPKPMLPASARTSGDPSVSKQMKKLAYIPLAALEAFTRSLGGQETFDPFSVNQKFGEYFVTEKASVSGVETVDHPAAQDAEPFSVGAFRFDENGGLYLLAEYQSEEQATLVEKLLALLGIEGIGGKISAGYGKFAVSETIDLSRTDDPAVQALASMLNAADATHYLLLTTALPKEEELDRVMDHAYYKLVRRAGFVSSEDISRPIKKKTQYFFGAGSVVDRKFEGDLYDVGDHMPHPVYRYGKPVFLGVNIG